MEIDADFWPGQRLSKKLCGRRGLYVSFSTAGLHPGSWINRLSVSREKFHVTIYVEKARVLRSNLTMFRPCYVWKYYEWFWEVLWLPRKSFIVWFTESVDRQISGMCGWARVTRILCVKHKNASWVFSSGDFVLESLFCAQRLWILNLFSADTELWASRFDWLKDYNFWTFQMLFISSQNPVTSARELYRLLPAIMLSLFSLS